jgi:hypothetical protein
MGSQVHSSRFEHGWCHCERRENRQRNRGPIRSALTAKVFAGIWKIMRRVIDAAGGILLLSLGMPAVAQAPVVGPPAPAARSAAAPEIARVTASADAERRAKRTPFVGASSPNGDVQLGLGLFRVQKTDDVDPNRHAPMRDTFGKTQRVAALGASFRF